VRVEFVYEPPQQGGAETLVLERGTPEEAQVGGRRGGLGRGGPGRIAELLCFPTASVGLPRQVARHIPPQTLPQVDFLAELMGLKKVGWVFAQSNKQRDYIISGEEVVEMATIQV
jgi:hypothetical protein